MSWLGSVLRFTLAQQEAEQAAHCRQHARATAGREAPFAAGRRGNSRHRVPEPRRTAGAVVAVPGDRENTARSRPYAAQRVSGESPLGCKMVQVPVDLGVNSDTAIFRPASCALRAGVGILRGHGCHATAVGAASCSGRSAVRRRCNTALMWSSVPHRRSYRLPHR